MKRHKDPEKPGYDTSPELRPLVAAIEKSVAAERAKQAEAEKPKVPGAAVAGVPGIAPVYPGTFLTDPVQALTYFLKGWKLRDWASMQGAATRTWRYSKRTEDTVAPYHGRILEYYGQPEELPTGENDAARVYQRDYAVPVRWFDPYIQKRIETKLVFRLTREKAPYTPSADPGSSWGVNPLSGLREVKEAQVMTDATEAKVEQ